MASKEKTSLQELAKGLWRENPVFALVIGLCPAMAVTNTLMNAIVMSLATTFVLLGSSTFVSILRRVIPGPVRISIYIIIIATFVSLIDWILAALMPVAHKQLGAFISLIVVNCLILGRAEAFASRNRLGVSVSDALGMSLGFAIAMVMIAAPRELLGSGTLLGFQVMPERFEPWVVMVLPPGGFLTLAAELAALAAWKNWREQRQRPQPVERAPALEEAA